MKANKAVATPEYIGDIMSGRRDQIPLSEYPDPSLPIALYIPGADKPTCHLEITACWYDGEGWTVTVRPWTYQHQPRLLRSGSPLTGGGKARLMSARKRNFQTVKAKDPADREWTEDAASGYTARPELAIQDAGEAVPEDYQDTLTMRALAQDAARKRAQSLANQRDRELLTITQRIELAKQAARQNHIDIGTDLLLLHRSMRERRSEAAIARRLADVELRAHRDAA